MKQLLAVSVLPVLSVLFLGCQPQAGIKTEGSTAPVPAARDIVFAAVTSTDKDPFVAGKAAATAAKAKLGDAPVKAVLLSESFEDKERKERVLAGVCSVFGKDVVFGSATYGTFTQAGVATGEQAGVLAIAGRDVAVASALRTDLGTSQLTVDKDMPRIEKLLTAAGRDLAGKLPRQADSRLMIVLADAHSPKNGALVAGIRQGVGKDFAVTGGSANKNAGQTFLYYRGEMLKDVAVGLMLSGDFRLAQSGRQAKDNEKVIATAGQGAAEAMAGLARQKARPVVVIAYDCAGRKGKLSNVADELAAMRKSLGTKVTLFGTYNAGEIGPPDVTEKLEAVKCAGVGWHVMFTAIGW
jgi:hypothetical protein